MNSIRHSLEYFIVITKQHSCTGYLSTRVLQAVQDIAAVILPAPSLHEVWSRSETTPRRAKHLDLPYHYIRDCVQKEVIKPVYVASSENEADGMTKPLGRTAFERFRTNIGVHAINTQKHRGVVLDTESSDERKL